MTTARLDHCTMQLDPVIWARIERRAKAMHDSEHWHHLLELLDFRERVTITEVSAELGLSRGAVRQLLDVLITLKVVRSEPMKGHVNAYLLNREDLWILFV